MTSATASAAPGLPRGAGRARSADGQVLGGLLVLGGIAWFLREASILTLGWQTMLSALLIALGFGMLVTSRRRGGLGLMVVGAVVTLGLASASAVSVDLGILSQGFGERAYRPLAASDLPGAGYRLGVGSMRLDLRDLDVPDEGITRIAASVGFGELIVVVPPALQVSVHTKAGGGKISVFGKEVKGNNLRPRALVDEGFDSETAADVELFLSTAGGQIEVVRAGR